MLDEKLIATPTTWPLPRSWPTKLTGSPMASSSAMSQAR
jgi:hypothetical protein